MAKRKVRPHPGTLLKVLKRKGMTQVDAAGVTGVDRKTLAKINRGEEVKLETLQSLAKNLNVPITHFETAPADDEINDALDPVHNLMLGKLTAERLAAMLKNAQRVCWWLNVQVIDEKTHNFLEQFEDAVKDFHQHLSIPLEDLHDGEPDSLRLQLHGLKKAKCVASLLEQFAQYRLVLLGADYLFWNCSSENYEYDDVRWSKLNYTSSRTVLLSVEPSGTQPRRVRVSPGSEPPKFAPNASTIVIVDGRELLGDF